MTKGHLIVQHKTKTKLPPSTQQRIKIIYLIVFVEMS